MHLILALSVIILHHVGSYSCRSVISKPDALHLKSAEDLTESYELKNEEIMEFLHPFVKSDQLKSPKHQTLQKNLAKLTIEPYLERNKTHQWERNPFSPFNNRKTIAPLAIILTHLSDLKPKQTRGNMQMKNHLKDEAESNNSYLSSRVTNEITQSHPIKPNIQRQSPEEVMKIDTDKEKHLVSDSEGNKQISYKTNSVNSKTFKPVISESAVVVTKSQDVLPYENNDRSGLDINKSHEDYTDVQSKTKLKTDQSIGEGSFIQSIKPLEAVENERGELILNDIDSTDLNYGDNSANDKIQEDFTSVSLDKHSSIAQDREQSQELNQRQDIEVRDEVNIKENSQGEFDYFAATKSSSENDRPILEIRNNDQLIIKSKEPESSEYMTKNSPTFHQIDYVDRNEEDGLEVLLSARQDPLHSYEDYIVSESLKLSKEHVMEDSRESERKNPYIPEEGSYREEKTLSKEPFEQNSLTSSVKVPQNIFQDIDKEINNENSLEVHENALHNSHNDNNGLKEWHHDIHDWHHFHPHNLYNLCFHFNR